MLHATTGFFKEKAFFFLVKEKLKDLISFYNINEMGFYNYIMKVKARLEWKIDRNLSDPAVNIDIMMNSRTLAKYFL